MTDYNDRIEEMLEKVQKAPRYTGGEMNAQVKSWEEAPLHFAFCFPDTYEIGMSHLGMKILTGIINDQDWSLAERCFMPWVDMMELMKENQVPLFSLESRRPLKEFDVVGFTLMYEMSYSNVLAMLEMGGIPIMRDERGEEDPIVVAGGGCASNPEPMSPFIDAFMIGAGEEVILEVIRHAASIGLKPAGLTFSPITGPEGNIEYLAHFLKKETEQKTGENAPEEDAASVVRMAHETLASSDRSAV